MKLHSREPIKMSIDEMAKVAIRHGSKDKKIAYLRQQLNSLKDTKRDFNKVHHEIEKISVEMQ